MRKLLPPLVLVSMMSTSHGFADAPDLHEGHGLYHEYYQYWYNGRGTHCCDERHCRPAEPGEFRWHNGRWQVKLGEWRDIQGSDYVVDDRGLGPFGSICHEGTHLYCVDLPDASY